MTCAISLHNADIRLRAPEPADLDALYELENDETLWPYGNTTVPFSHYALKKYIEKNTHDLFADRQARFIIEQTDSKALIGVIDLVNFDPLHLRAELGIVVLPTQRKKGYAFQSVELLSNYCLKYIHLHQLYVLISTQNAASSRLFTRCGFTVSSVLKDWLLSENGFVDVQVMQKILR